MSLNKQDLEAIGTVVHEQVLRVVPKIIRDEVRSTAPAVAREVVLNDTPKIIQTEVLVTVEAIVQPQFNEIKGQLKSIDQKIDRLTTSVDGIVGTVSRHDQELIILGAQQDKVHSVLVKKNIATEDELAVA